MEAKSTPQAVKLKSNVVVSPTGLTSENKAANKGTGTFTHFYKLNLSPSQKFCNSFFKLGVCKNSTLNSDPFENLTSYGKATSKVSMDYQLITKPDTSNFKRGSEFFSNDLDKTIPHGDCCHCQQHAFKNGIPY